MMRKPRLMGLATVLGAIAVLLTVGKPARMLQAQNPPGAVKKSEADRIKVINDVKSSVVAIYARGGGGGGSGVIIDAEGFALTNYHVVAGTGPTMVCGLANGVLYDAVIVGIDKVGDVALIKLMPEKPGDKFPFVKFADSDRVQVGEWSLAMGNPFLLATDFTPSVSYGLISGVHRYQYPEGKGTLEYTDCIQFDTTINPGNSGGPLFNMSGELIGINGRGSFAQDKRFRINCGVGYAISINQIKNFLGHLRAGLDCDHATLGATVETASEDGLLAEMVVKQVLDPSDAQRRDLQEGDKLITFAGRPLGSVNQFKNILGIFPKDWRMPMVTIRDKDAPKETLVRLMSYTPSVIPDPKNPAPQPGPQPKGPAPKGPEGKGAPLYKAKKGFTNYYFNEAEQKRLLESFKKHGDFSNVGGDWVLEGTYNRDEKIGNMKIAVTDVKAEDGKSTKALVKLAINTDYDLEPLNSGVEQEKRMFPPYSGGLMMAMYHYRRFMTQGPKGFELENFYHGGYEPFYVQPIAGPPAKSFKDIRLMTEVIRTEHAAVTGKWYFYRADLNPDRAGKKPYEDGQLVGFEIFLDPDLDPCEVYLHEYKKDDNDRDVPGKMEVRYGDKRYGVLAIQHLTMGATK